MAKSASTQLIDPGSDYRLIHGDCIKEMAKLPAHSVDMEISSPPFPALYAYTDSPSDIGNSEDLAHETSLHLTFFYRQLARVMKPGRVAIIHVCQIPRMKRAGGRGLCDFRGLNIRLGERAGLIYTYDWLIEKNPQAQAIRTRSRELQFMGLETDRAKSRGALADYLIKFEAPGDNQTPVDSHGEVSRNDWIAFADAAWSDIKETDTLNTKAAKSEDDTRHICPLQLEVIRRMVRLYSNPGEVVLSPFAGIGSEGYVALKEGRRFVGIELKEEYFHAADKNLKMAIQLRKTKERTLFDGVA